MGPLNPVFDKLITKIILVPAIPGAILLALYLMGNDRPEYWYSITLSLFVSCYTLALLTIVLMSYGGQGQRQQKNRLLLLAIMGGWLLPQFWIMLAYMMTGATMVAYPFVFRGDSALTMWVFSATFGSAGSWIFSFPSSFIIVYTIASVWTKTRC